MKNINRYITVISILILALICACCRNNADNASNLNPFSDIDIGDNTTIASEYGHTPYNAPEDFTYYYQGSVLNIPYTFYGGRVDSEVGLLIFIDGIVQQYSLDDSEGAMDDYMKIFNISANSEETYMLNIIPNCGKSGDILKLNFVCIDFPIQNMLDEASLDLQNMSTTISWRLSYLEDANALTFPPQKEFRIKTISSTIEDYYADKDEFGSGLEKADITFEGKNKVLKFIANAGENDGHYKTTIFMDNKPAIIDGDNSFIEYKINKDEQLTHEAKIDDNSLNDTNILYAISIRLDNAINDWQQHVDAFKTNSILINAY